MRFAMKYSIDKLVNGEWLMINGLKYLVFAFSNFQILEFSNSQIVLPGYTCNAFPSTTNACLSDSLSNT